MNVERRTSNLESESGSESELRYQGPIVRNISRVPIEIGEISSTESSNNPPKRLDRKVSREHSLDSLEAKPKPPRLQNSTASSDRLNTP